jgi:hypothetical protein
MFNWNKKEKPFASFGGFGGGGLGLAGAGAPLPDELPILKTNDSGTSAIGGLNDDSFASSLQFAIPGGTSGGINLTDQSPTGRTSGTRNISNGGSLANNTSISKYYGGSLYITGGATGSFSTDVWNSIGSGEFTVEMWIYLASSSQSDGYGSTIMSSRAAGDNGAGWYSVGFGGMSGNVPSLAMNMSGGITHYISNDGSQTQFPSGQWTHIAQTKDSSNNVRTYRNGIKIAQGNSSQALNAVNRGLIGGHDYGNYASYQSFHLNDIRIYNTAKYTGDSFNLFL